MKFLLIYIILYCFTISLCETGEDLYKLLGVSRDATSKEIRKAFKSLAVKLHPDKNKDDEDAEAKFIKIAKAYEVLKDPEIRKYYDVNGDIPEASGDTKGRQYHSYTYYKEQFGIYDDDPLIITLSKADYEVNILDNNQAWFVNFYSPHCHHCHELAPTWRKLAADLEGVIRIAAVNCEDDWPLCYQLGIQSYPSLLFYEKEATIHDGQRFAGSKTFDRLKSYVLSKLTVMVESITKENWETSKDEPWLLFLCGDDNSNCPEEETRLKMAAIFEGLMKVGEVKDGDLCRKISKSFKENSPVVFWEIDNKEEKRFNIHSIAGSDTKEILNGVLNILPNPETISEAKFQEIRANLRTQSVDPWLLCFYIGTATDLNLQLKRIPSMLSNINIGLVHCGKSSTLCSSLHIPRYPTWGILKSGGAFEIHEGRDILYEIVNFAKESARCTNLHALSPADFHNIINAGSTWFIDWYAPWCPPCRRLMPELRRASTHFHPEKVQFGTVDCTLHRNLCMNEGISSYPTTKLYNGSQIYAFFGVPNEEGIVEFVQDMLNPIVIDLNQDNFKLLENKPKNEMWVVDFFAPWCHPCQKLAPEWRRLAKQMLEFPEVKIAHVNCETQHNICNGQNVRGYPTIRLYPLGTRGLSSVAIYNGNRDVVSLKRWILNFLPSPVLSMDKAQFTEQILSKKFAIPWLVDFYAPWCGHCIHFEPEFRRVAEVLEGHIRSAKVDCEAERMFCGSLRIVQYPTVILYFTPTDRREIISQNAKDVIREVRSLLAKREHEHIGHDEL